MRAITTLTQKGQATIPQAVREKLDLHTGDKIRFEIVDKKVIISKVSPFDYEYYQALEQTLSEWNCKEDEEAYGDL